MIKINVKLARVKMNLTQKELAEKVNTSNVTIVKIEKGNFDNVRFGTLKKIAEALNSTVADLFLND